MAVTGSPELLIVMGAHATPEEIEHVVAAPRRGRRRRARHARPRGDGDRRDRRARGARGAAARGLPRRRAGAADPEAVQARLARALAGPDRDRGARPPHRRRRLRADRRAVHGRVPRADARDGARGRAGRRDDAPRRRVQAAHLAVHLQRARRGGARDPRRGARGDRPADRHRADGPAPRRGACSSTRT